MSNEKVTIESEEWDEGDVLFDPTHVREVTDTNLVDEHQSQQAIQHDLEETGEDWGDGFIVQDQPVLIERDPDGGIVRVTPLSEIPGVSFEGQVLTQDPDLLTNAQKELKLETAEAKETLVPVGKAERDKIKEILAIKLFKDYQTEAALKNKARWNPFRDGLPDRPEDAPHFMKPTPEMPLIPATPGQVFIWLKKEVGKHFEVIDKKGGRGGSVEDIALRIR